MYREQLAWAAGIIDGEGHCGNKTKTVEVRQGIRTYYTPHFSVGQVNWTVKPQMLQRLEGIFPFGKVYGPKTKIKIKWAPAYSFEVNGFEKVQAIYTMVWPWLGDVKRQQYLDSMGEYIQNRAPRDYWYGPAPGSRRNWPRNEKGQFIKHS